MRIVFYLTLGISVFMLLLGFFLPPMGIIDNSVLIACGELFGFGALGLLPMMLSSNKDIKVKKGDTSITVSDKIDDADE